MKTKIRLKMQVKLWQKKKMVFDGCLRLKDRVLRAVQVRMWSKAYIKVNYGGGVYNDIYCYSLPDFKKALSAFTEKPLIEYLTK